MCRPLHPPLLPRTGFLPEPQAWAWLGASVKFPFVNWRSKKKITKWKNEFCRAFLCVYMCVFVCECESVCTCVCNYFWFLLNHLVKQTGNEPSVAFRLQEIGTHGIKSTHPQLVRQPRTSAPWLLARVVLLTHNILSLPGLRAGTLDGSDGCKPCRRGCAWPVNSDTPGSTQFLSTWKLFSRQSQKLKTIRR